MKLLGISATITGSKTKVIVESVLSQVKKNDSNINTQLLDLKDYQLMFCDGREPNDYSGDTKKVIEFIREADFYIIGSPVFQGSFTGVLKNLFDLLPPITFRNKVVGLVANGGTWQHFLMIENQLKPILGYFRSYTVPSYVYVHSQQFNKENEIIDNDVKKRIENLAEEVVFMQKRLKSEEVRKDENDVFSS